MKLSKDGAVSAPARRSLSAKLWAQARNSG